jgi:hypothetical protein
MMENKSFSFSEVNIQDQIGSFMNTMVMVITNPVGFFKTMPKTGGLVEPLIFMVLIGVVGGVLQAILSIFGVGLAGSFFVALACIIIGPIAAAIFGFVAAAVFFLVWQVLRSREPFETAFRCAAYVFAITPLTTLLGVIPYAGAVLGLAWMTYLLVVASVEVHEIDAKNAWMVFGIIAALLALLNISSQLAARRISSKINQFQKTMEQTEQMSPEEAGEKLGKFLKGMEKGAGKP